MKTANNIFRLLFVFLALIWAVGFVVYAKNHCLWAALVCYAISRIFIIESIQSKEYSKLNERRQTWYKQGNILNRRLSRR